MEVYTYMRLIQCEKDLNIYTDTLNNTIESFVKVAQQWKWCALFRGKGGRGSQSPFEVSKPWGR